MSFVEELFSISGRTAILTGAGGHLIGEMSRGLGKAGCNVAVLDLREEKAETVAQQIRDAGGSALALACDATRKSDLEHCLATTVAEYGSVSIAVNGAGINAPTPFLDIQRDDWQAVMDSQITSTFLSCQVFGAHMLEHGRGSMINISSASAGPPLSKAFAYSVAKAGIMNLTQNLGREWGTQGVRVNAIRPGFFPTDWNRKNFITPEREAAILGHTAMQRYGEVSELVGALIWLASDASSFVTGAEIAVDGGYSAMTI
jgi:NAD(P)-dependent dehydrogenase (short-subunit alcohol dehydrogenase family)